MRQFHFSFDWRAMGLLAYVPFVVFLLLALYSFVSSLNHLIPALEAAVPTFASWWSIFLFQDFLEEPGGETIFSQPIARWKLGFARVGFFLVLYIISLSVLLTVIGQWVPIPQVSSLLLQLTAQSVFFAGLGFFSMVITDNSGWALVVIIVYTCTEILTKGSLLPFLNVFLFNTRVLPFSSLWGSVLTSIVVGLLFLCIAQLLLSRKLNFK